MRPDRLYLTDIVHAADAIARFLADVDEETIFLVDELHQSAVLQKLIVIGEAATRVSPELKQAHPEVPWPDIAGFRNIAVHAYFSVDWSIVWNTATRDVLTLRDQVTAILGSMSGDELHQE
jgi:uncharacterized protein with HEPN domain